MAITGSTDLGNGKLVVTVNHDPTVTPTDCPAGSLIIDTAGNWYRKVDDPVSTNVAFAFSGFSVGTSGFSGYSGASSASGQSGYTGVSGYSGPSGISGTSGKGLSGFSGYTGWSGISGKSGYSGLSSKSGTSGFSGYSSVSGPSGFSGISGFSGPGDSGFSGVSGFSADSGVSGFSGFSGTFSGYSGWSGEQGAIGFSGLSGYSGNIQSFATFATATASGNSTRVNTTTVTNDQDLHVALNANSDYFIHCQLHFTQNFTNNFTNMRLWFGYTGTASNVQINYFGTNTADTSLLYQTQSFFGNGNLLFLTSNPTHLWAFDINGYFKTSTAGTLSLQWAQGNSQPTTITMNIGSYLEARENQGAVSGISGFSSASGFSGISLDAVTDPFMLTLFG